MKIKTRLRKAISFIALSTLLFNPIFAFANLSEGYQVEITKKGSHLTDINDVINTRITPSEDEKKRLIDNLKYINGDSSSGEKKYGFLIEGLKSDGTSKIPKEGYSWKNIGDKSSWNIWGNNDLFGNLRIETPSSQNIAEYRASQFQWNIPYKKYELDSSGKRISENGTPVYNDIENQNLCTYGLTRSIDDTNDLSTRLDIYGTTEDGKNLIGFDVVNTQKINSLKFLLSNSSEKAKLIDLYGEDTYNYLVQEYEKSYSKNYYNIKDDGDINIYNNISFEGLAINKGLFGTKSNLSDYLETINGKDSSYLSLNDNGSIISIEDYDSQNDFFDGNVSLGLELLKGENGINLDIISGKKYSLSTAIDQSLFITYGDVLSLIKAKEGDIKEKYIGIINNKIDNNSESDLYGSISRDDLIKTLNYYNFILGKSILDYSSEDYEVLKTKLKENLANIITNHLELAPVYSENLIQDDGSSLNKINVEDFSYSYNNSEKKYEITSPSSFVTNILNMPLSDISESIFKLGSINYYGKKINSEKTVLYNSVSSYSATPSILDISEKDGKATIGTRQASMMFRFKDMDEEKSIVNNIFFNGELLSENNIGEDSYSSIVSSYISNNNIGNMGNIISMNDIINNIPVNINYTYKDSLIQDFYLSNIGDDSFRLFDNLKNILQKIVFFTESYSNGKSYLLTDSTTSSEEGGQLKEVNKKPFVFPVTQIINNETRKYNNHGVDDAYDSLKGGDYSYFNACISNKEEDLALTELYKATPESDVYTKTLENASGKKYEVSYKVLTMQFKYSGELGLGKDLGSFASVPGANKINLGTFMNTFPLVNSDGLEIDNFLSTSIMEKSPGITIWNNKFSGGNTVKKDYQFKVFTPSNVNVLKYDENGASNKNYELNSLATTKQEQVLHQSLVNDSTSETILELGTSDTNISQKSLEGVDNIYMTPTCPVGYSLYDDYVGVYNELYSSTINSEGYDPNSLFQKINSDNTRNVTTFFNTPRPFCVHNNSGIDSKEKVLSNLDKMFNPENEGNLFSYTDTSSSKKVLSDIYIKSLQTAFITKNNPYPNYNNLSSNIGDYYSNYEGENLVSLKGFNEIDLTSDSINKIINFLFFNNTISLDESENKELGVSKINKLLDTLKEVNNKIYQHQVYGITLLKSSGKINDFSASVNSKIFPVIGATINYRKSGEDFYCNSKVDNSNYFIINGECYNKNEGGEQGELFIYNGDQYVNIANNGAFINNTQLITIFDKGLKLKDTSGTLYVNSNSIDYPYITNDSDNLNLSPNNANTSTANANKIALTTGFGQRASGFLFPYRNTVIKNYADNYSFGNILINANGNMSKEDLLNSYRPFLLENKGTTISSEIIKVPTFLERNINSGEGVNPNMDYYFEYYNNNPLYKKAKIVTGESGVSILLGNAKSSITDSSLTSLNKNTLNKESEKYKGKGEIYNFQIDNKNGGLDLNSVTYMFTGREINENCLFSDNRNNNCIIPYKTSNYVLDIYDNDKTVETKTVEDGIGSCTNKDNTILEFDSVDKDTYDYNNDGMCDLVCKNTLGENIPYSWNAWSLYVKNEGDSQCLAVLPSGENKSRLFDGYTLNNFLLKDLSLNGGFDINEIGKNKKSSEKNNGNGISLNDDNGNCSYESDGRLKCYDGFLSKYNINDGIKISDINPAIKNGYIYAKYIEEGRKQSTDYTSIYNKDLVVLSSNNLIDNTSLITEGGYINGTNNFYNKVDRINGGIKSQYLFSDNDNLKGEGQSLSINPLINSSTKTLRQSRRDLIKGEIKLSSFSSDLDSLKQTPTDGLNYVSYKINKNDFYSLNGILRLSKDTTRYFSNLKIQDPDNELNLLSEKNINETIYSFNNTTIKYGNKYYTWGNNDTSCNKINPNEVYNKIDTYNKLTGKSNTDSREDTMTICLRNEDNLSGELELDNNIYVLIPVKPTKGYNKKSKNGIESEIILNSNFATSKNISVNSNYWDSVISNGENYNKTYYQGYWKEDSSEQYLEGFSPSSDSDIEKLNKGRMLKKETEYETERQSACCGGGINSDCKTKYRTEYRARVKITREFNSLFNSNQITLKNIPKIFISGFITKNTNSMDVKSPLNANVLKISTNYNNSKGVNSQYTNWGAWDYISGSCRNYNGSKSGAYDNIESSANNISYAKRENEVIMNKQSIYSILTKINDGNEITSYKVPEKDVLDYSNGISYTNTINDTYLKSGNLKNNISTFGDNNDYVESSLKENNYNVNVGDYLEFEHKIVVENDVVPQQLLLETYLDRGLDLEESSLSFEKNGITQKTIFNETVETEEYLYDKYETNFIINKFNKSSSTSYKVSENKGSYIPYSNSDEKITVINGKLYLKIDKPVKVFGSKGVKYWNKKGANTIEYISENNNGILKEEDISDVFKEVGITLIKDSVLIIDAGNYVRFEGANGGALTSNFAKIVPYNYITDLYGNYNLDNIGQTGNFGIPSIDSGINDYTIFPNKAQSVYTFKCNTQGNLQNMIDNSSFYKDEIIDGVNYCGVYNKYNDDVFDGYLNKNSDYLKTVIPSELYRFSYSNPTTKVGKLLGSQGIDDGKYLGLPERGFQNGDSEKLLLTNLGVLKQGDTVIIKYKAKVNKYNDIGHVLYNYNTADTLSDVNKLNETDTLLTGNIISNNKEIYTQALKSKLIYFTHYGKTEEVKNQEFTFDGTESIKSKIEITPNLDLSIINLGGRKGYYACNPVTEKEGTCDVIYSQETLNKDKTIKTVNGIIKKEGEAQGLVYKGQKFLLRATLTNDFFELDNINNNLNSLDVSFYYNKNLALFDGIIIENKFKSKDNGAIVFNDSGERDITTPSEELTAQDLIAINNSGNNVYTENNSDSHQRIGLIADIETEADLTQKFKKINYKLKNIDNFNKEGGATIDLLFTARSTLTESEITELFENAFISDLNSIFISNVNFEKTINSELIHPLINNENIAFSEIKEDYDNSYNAQIESLHNDSLDRVNNVNSIGTKNFLYYKMPYGSEYQLEDKKKITNLNPKLAVFKSRITNKGGTNDGVINGTSNDGELALELKIVNTSNKIISINEKSLEFSLPNGFSLGNIEKYTINRNNLANQKIEKTIFENSKTNRNSKITLKKDFGKKVYSFDNELKTLSVGEQIIYNLKLTFDKNKTDLYSSFNSNISLENEIDTYNLFSDAFISIDKGLGELTVKTLPTFGENDVYIGGGYVKNKVNDSSYVEDNSGDSTYNILAGEGTNLDYDSQKSNSQILDGILQSNILNEDELFNEKEISYDVIKGNDLLSQDNISYVSGVNPHYLISPDVFGKITLKNNSLYYFGDDDVFVGSIGSDVGMIDIQIEDNTNKPDFGGIAIYTKGEININNNIQTKDQSNENNKNDLVNILYVSPYIQVNPRVTNIEGYFLTPLSENSYVNIDENVNLNINSDGNIGIFRPGYSNSPLFVKGNIISGYIANERENSGIILSTDKENNITENFNYNFNLYLNPPPIIRQ